VVVYFHPCVSITVFISSVVAALPKLAAGDHRPGDPVLALHGGNAPMDEKAEPGRRKPLRVWVSGAGEGRLPGGVVDTERGVLVSHRTGFLLLLSGGGRSGRGKEQGSAGH
jgi:hypothetical protein